MNSLDIRVALQHALVDVQFEKSGEDVVSDYGERQISGILEF